MEKIPPTQQSTEETPEHEGGMSMPPPVMCFDQPATPPGTKNPPATPPAPPPSTRPTTTTPVPSTPSTTAAPTTSGPTTTTTTATPVVPDPGRVQVLRDLVTMFPRGTTPVRTHFQHWQIMQTAEWRTLMDPAQQWRQTYLVSYEQAMDTCFRILEAITGTPPLPGTGAVNVATYVPASIRARSREEGMVQASGTAGLGGHATLVANFRTAVNAANTVAVIEGHVRSYGHQLWTDERTASRARTTDAQLANSDAAIYTARNAMRDVLRQHTFLSQAANLAELQRLVRCLEDESRGRADINFGAAPANAKRILITGFDPFGDDVTSNPSGIVAANLDGQTLSVGANAVAYLEALSFPVRYDDFDQGMVERIVGPIINDATNNISMVITISLAPDTHYLVTDRFAAHTRRGHEDNGGIVNYADFPQVFDSNGVVRMRDVTLANTPALRTRLAQDTYRFLVQHYGNLGTIPVVPNVDTEAALLAYLNGAIRPFLTTIVRNHFQPQGANGPEFIRSNMNLSGMIADPNRPSNMGVDQSFQSFDGNGAMTQQANNGTPGSGTGGNLPATTAAQVTGAQTPNAADAARAGSGGDYLSNEIYYRVSALRTAHGGNLKNVHIHIPNPTDTRADNGAPFGMARIISEVRGIITVAAQNN